jgi:hypothetical protein
MTRRGVLSAGFTEAIVAQGQRLEGTADLQMARNLLLTGRAIVLFFRN